MMFLMGLLDNLSDKIYNFPNIIAMTPPSKINLNKAKTVLTVTFDGIDYGLSSEFSRNSPGWKRRCNNYQYSTNWQLCNCFVF